MDYLSKMKSIPVALDTLQRNKCHHTNAAVIWKKLQEKLGDLSVSDLMELDSRIATALIPAHFLTYLLNPRYYGSPHNSAAELTKSTVFLSEYQPSSLPSSHYIPCKIFYV